MAHLATKHTEAGLAQIANFVRTAMVQDLISQGKRATGNLVNSFKFTIQPKIGFIELSITAADYAPFVDRGRRRMTKRVPIGALIKWIEQKGLESGDKSKKDLAFAIQTKIWKEGIAATNFVERGLDVARVQVNKLGKDMRQDVELFVRNLVRDQERRI